MAFDNIVLIGFMGSGKSSVGRLLAKELGYMFLDTDALIESSQGMPIAQLFTIHGQGYFRACEAQTIEWIGNHAHKAVVSTGGGLPVYSAIVAPFVVYLDLPFEAIIKRLSEDEMAKRPLFNDATQARTLYEERQTIYTQVATHRIDAQQPLQEIVKQIISLYQKD